MARITIAKRLKKRSGRLTAPAPFTPEKAQRKEWEILELDGLWSFVGHKKAQGLVVARHVAGPAADCGLGAGQPGRSPVRQTLACPASPLPPSVLVLYRPV